MADLVADRLPVNPSSFARSPRGSPPQWRDSSSFGTTLSSSRLLSPPVVLPSALAARAAVLAFGDELLVLPDDKYEWRTPGGRDSAAAYLLSRAEAALRQRQDLQRLADAANRARKGQALSSHIGTRLRGYLSNQVPTQQWPQQ
jgi:hypothetical protein